jgi:putative oxidoreductase
LRVSEEVVVRGVLCGGVRGSSALFELGLTPLRVFAGLALALGHGLGKLPPSAGFIERVGGFGFPVPVLFAWGATASELVGGMLLAIGLLTRPSAFFILCTMTVAVVFQHANDPFSGKEKAMLFGFIAIGFLFVGAGRWSVDALLQKRR